MGICLPTTKKANSNNKNKDKESKQEETQTEQNQHNNNNKSSTINNTSINNNNKKQNPLFNTTSKSQVMKNSNKTETQIEELCKKYKDIGNDYFRKGDYYEALNNYSEAIVSEKYYQLFT